MAADCVIAPGTEVFLHARAGVAIAGREQERGTEAEGAVFQGVQVDATNEDVAAEQGGIDRVAAEVAGDGGQVLELHQRDLAGSALAVIADQAAIRIEIGVCDGAKRLAPRWTKADPDDLAGAHGCGEEAGERGGRVQQAGLLRWAPEKALGHI
jgi:hypothetical protein